MTGPTTLDFRAPPFDAEVLREVVEHLRSGGLVAYPTETVYGFGCALVPGALERLLALKGRDPDRPLLLLVPEGDGTGDLRWTAEARELAAAFWPGALTLVLADPNERFPPGIRSPEGGVAVRRTPHPVAAALVEALAAPLTSTSANRPGDAPALSAEEAEAAARSLGAGAEMWVLDGGTLAPSPPSTVVDCTGPEIRVLRPGAVPPQRLRCVRPELDAR